MVTLELGLSRTVPGTRMRRAVACALLVPATLAILASLDQLASSGDPTIAPSLHRHWPYLVAAFAAGWLCLRGFADVTARSRDVLYRIARAAGALTIAMGEVWAGSALSAYHDGRSGHLAAGCGLALLVVAGSVLELRAAWLRRVARGRVPGWRLRSHADGDERLELLSPALTWEHLDVLVRLHESGSAYRGPLLEIPVARVAPRSFARAIGKSFLF